MYPLSQMSQKYSVFSNPLLRVNNDILSAMDDGKITALILLDLSAAFDTVRPCYDIVANVENIVSRYRGLKIFDF